MAGRAPQERSEIRDVLEHLIERSGKNLNEIANGCGLPYQTLYNIRHKSGTLHASAENRKPPASISESQAAAKKNGTIVLHAASKCKQIHQNFKTFL